MIELSCVRRYHNDITSFGVSYGRPHAWIDIYKNQFCRHKTLLLLNVDFTFLHANKLLSSIE